MTTLEMERTKMKGALDNDKITALLQNTKTKNAYGPQLLEFLESDEAAINPREAWPHLYGTKSAATLYQGFRNAAEKNNLSDTVSIRKVEDDVFILHKDRVAIAITTETDDDQ